MERSLQHHVWKITGSALALGFLFLIGLGVWASFFPRQAGAWDRLLIIGWIQTLAATFALFGVVLALIYAQRQLRVMSNPSKIYLSLGRTFGAERARIKGGMRDMVVLAVRMTPGVGTITSFTLDLLITHDKEAAITFEPWPLWEKPRHLTQTEILSQPDRTRTAVRLVYSDYDLTGANTIYLGTLYVQKGLIQRCWWSVDQPSGVTSGDWTPRWTIPKWALPLFRENKPIK